MTPTPRPTEPSVDLLRTLAGLDATPHAIVSLYLDCRWSDEQQRDRVWIPLRHALGRRRRQADTALARDLDAIAQFAEARVKQRADVGVAGVARFLCSPLGLDVVVRSHLALPTLLELGPRALVHPLATLPLEERVLVVTADAERVRVRVLQLGRLEDCAALDGPTPPRHSEGGHAQLKLQHWRNEIEDALHIDAAREIGRLFDATPATWVIVGGSVEGAANLLTHLPQRVRARAVPLDDLSLAAEQARAERALERGPVGIHPVARALDEGRVARVLVARTLPSPLTELLAVKALRTAARVDVLRSDALDAVGAAALLRF